jgi:hypothetical protein
MGITYKIDSAHAVVRARWHGIITSKVLAEYWKVLLSDKDAMACRGVITDATNCEVKFSGTELLQCVETIFEPGFHGRVWKSAVIVNKPVQHGVARQMEAFAAPVIELRIFNDASQALEWLLS